MLRNKLYGFLTVALSLSLFLTLCPVHTSAKAEQSVSAKAAVLYEPETETFLFSKNSDARLPMASTTKIMTALVAIERENLDTKITVDSRAVGIEGSSAYLKAGEVFTLKELLFALMLQSANDAAEAIAYAIAGSVDAFAELMNQKAYSLGLLDTNFTNPHGLDNESHYTTASDLAKIAASALEYPEFFEITSTKSKRVKKNGVTRLFVNHNKLLSLYDGCIGIKTGFTKKSGRCLVSAAERDGVRLICVTIDAPNDWNDHRCLLDYGFSFTKRETLFSADAFEYTLPVLNSENLQIKLGISEDVSIISFSSDQSVKAEIQLPRFISAPVRVGDKIGKIVVFKNGEIISTHDILAKETVCAKKKRGLLGLFE